MVDYYQTNFTLTKHFNLNLSDLNDMFFWEREIYTSIIKNYNEEQKLKELESKSNMYYEQQGFVNGI